MICTCWGVYTVAGVQNVSGQHPNVLGNTDWAKGRQANKKIQQYFCWHLRHVADLIFAPYPNRYFPSSMRGLVDWMEITFIIFKENVGAQPSPKV